MRNNLLECERPADVPQDLLRVASAGRGGNGPRLPVCVSTPNPERPGRRAELARQARNRLTELLESIGMRNLAACPTFEEEGDPGMPSQTSQVETTPSIDPPPFYIVQQCGKLVLTTWGALYEVPSYMWQPGLVVLTREEDNHAASY